MAQIGMHHNGRTGSIYYDSSSGARGFRCEAGRCTNPCAHCSKKQCRGLVHWTIEQLERGDTVTCSAAEKHSYRLHISG